MLHFALTGLPPFQRDTLHEAMLAHVDAPPTPPSLLMPGLPSEIDELVLRMMQKRAEDRGSSAHAMRGAVLATQDAVREAMLDPARNPRAGRHAASETTMETSMETTPATVAATSASEAATARLPLLPPPGMALPSPNRPGIGGRRPRRRCTRDAKQLPRHARGWLTASLALGLVAAVVALAMLATLQGSAFLGVRSISERPAPQVAPSEEPPPVAPTIVDAPPPQEPPEPEPEPELAAVPEVVGATLAEATRQIEAAGLTVGEVRSIPSPEPADTVLKSSREAGALIDAGAAIRLTIASGLNIVPDLDGLSAAEAAATLHDAGFVAVFDDGSSAPGDPATPADPAAGVTQTSPAAQTTALLGSSVILSLAESAPAPEPPPVAEPTPTVHLALAIGSHDAPNFDSGAPGARPRGIDR